MNYLVFSKEGVALHYLQVSGELQESFIPDTILKEAGEYSQNDLDCLRLNPVTDEIYKIEFNKPASEIQIKQMLTKLENAPIIVDSYVVDCDDVSLDKLKNYVTNFDNLPLISNMIEVVNDEKAVYWKMADNESYPFNKEELKSLYENTVLSKAVRIARLFEAYQRIKQIPGVTLNYVTNPFNWIN